MFYIYTNPSNNGPPNKSDSLNSFNNAPVINLKRNALNIDHKIYGFFVFFIFGFANYYIYIKLI